MILFSYLSIWMTCYLIMHSSVERNHTYRVALDSRTKLAAVSNRRKVGFQPTEEEPEDYLQNNTRHFATIQKIIDPGLDVKWVAFDGGVHFDSAKFNSISGAQKSIMRGAKILNIDLSMTADEHLFLTHSDNSFGDIEFPTNKLPRSISSMTRDEVLKRNIACIPENILRAWFKINTSTRYSSCSEEKIASFESFLQLVTAPEISFDLKAPTEQLQLEQALKVMETNTSSSFSVRFFSEGFDVDNRARKSIIPPHILHSLFTNGMMSHIRYYANAPSYMACSQIINWLNQEENPILNKNVVGCYVTLNDARMDETWNVFRQRHRITSNSSIPAGDYRYICDVPSKLKRPEIGFWGKQLIECVNSGFKYIHFPFSISPEIESRGIQPGQN